MEQNLKVIRECYKHNFFKGDNYSKPISCLINQQKFGV